MQNKVTPLSDINFLYDIIKYTKERDEDICERLYTDAIIGLVHMGLPYDDGVLCIDDTRYPIPDKALGILNRKQKPVDEKPKKTTGEPEKAEAPKEPSVHTTEVKEQEKEPLAPAVNAGTIGKGCIITSKIRIRVTNSEDASDVTESDILVSPLISAENEPVAPIAVAFSDNGKNLCKVSDLAGNRASVDIDLKGFKFNVRGEFKMGKFMVKVRALRLADKYQCDTEVNVIEPDEFISQSDYESTYCVKLGESEVYVLPLEKLPNAKNIIPSVVVLKRPDGRMQGLYDPEEGDHSAYVYTLNVNNARYRVYATYRSDKFAAVTDAF